MDHSNETDPKHEMRHTEALFTVPMFAFAGGLVSTAVGDGIKKWSESDANKHLTSMIHGDLQNKWNNNQLKPRVMQRWDHLLHNMQGHRPQPRHR